MSEWSSEFAYPSYDMLLTSVGPTTEPMQERLREMGKNAAKASRLNILVVADGWTPFDTDERVPALGRLTRKTEAYGTRAWTQQYLRYVLGSAAVRIEALGQLSEVEGRDAIGASDMLVVPGGNTFQTMNGLRTHADAVRQHTELGKPYVGNSAGSIITGLSTRPAGIEPADAVPYGYDLMDESALGLLPFDIAPHAAGRKEAFDMPGLRVWSQVAGRVAAAIETPTELMNGFVTLRQTFDGVEVKTLNDMEGLSVANGIIKKI